MNLHEQRPHAVAPAEPTVPAAPSATVMFTTAAATPVALTVSKGMCSPGRKRTSALLQRQVSRALELIELLDENTAGGNSPFRMNGVKKTPRTAFQMPLSSMKRKRSQSMSSNNGSTVVVAPRNEKPSTLLLDTDAAAPVVVRKKRVGVKKGREGRVTPTKRCNGKGSNKTKSKSDAIENALKKFRLERAKTDRSYEFDYTSTSGECDSNLWRLRVGVSLAQGARAYMEDRFTVLASLFEEMGPRSPKIVAVYDGHNGPFAADLASKRFREVLARDQFLLDVCQRDEVVLTDADINTIRNILIDMFVNVDDEILRLTIQKGKRDGTTVLFGLIIAGKMFIANAGDSRAVLGRTDDDIERLSVDHKPDTEVETKRVEEAGGKVIYSGCWRVAHDEVPLRLAISRSLGDHPLKVGLPASCSSALVSPEPDVCVLDLDEADDILVFASDGLWDRFTDHEAVDFARAKVLEFNALHADGSFSAEQMSRDSAKYAASALVEAALKRRSMDNITVIVMGWARADSDASEDTHVDDETSASASDSDVHVIWSDDEQSIEI
ncbi:TPA: hypothetical protein N0F65_012579 [Lagenidium giganteum]|uniref:PPM-type phosphatase domain-containing protein n=1 Tax=Lagenidium giganteum TaxID=4803 RepID=A0AAV2YMG2_9STRA|nr:TPA: hypothetical protein N0F65_012579 [Lagenidium giganteum]